jgi:hypothetical protein
MAAGRTPDRRTLGRRTLGRATLERQLLLSRSQLPLPDAVQQVAGVQAQTTHSWYTGLWSRVQGFQAADASGLLADRKLVRAALMRSTIHLVTATDCLALRPAVQAASERGLFGNVSWRRQLVGLDAAELAEAARALLDEQPRTPAELGALLAQRWPGREPGALAYAARCLLCLVQVPPRGLWGQAGRTRHATAEHWLGQPLRADFAPQQLITRYLAAFGPATVADMQAWSGLSGLREIVDSSGLALAAFRDEEGRILYDLPGASLPDPDVPAPVRFLPDYDNALLGHADRSRIATEPYVRYRASSRNGVVPGTVLVDGLTAATWTISHEKGQATITITPFTGLSRAQASAIAEEASKLLAFTDPGATQDVRLAADAG